MAVVWETLSQGTISWGAAKTTNLFLCFSAVSGMGPDSALQPLRTRDFGVWELPRLPWGDILVQVTAGSCLESSAPWAKVEWLRSPKCVHITSICVCVSTDISICRCVFIYICMHFTFQVTWSTQTSWKGQPTWKDESKNKWLQTIKLLLIFTAGGENSW